MLILTANCFIVFMKITQVQPCILWKTTPVDNPYINPRAPSNTLKHPNAHVSSAHPLTHPLANVSIVLKSHTNITPTPRQHLTRSQSGQTQQNRKS